jgi:hypothetical protein
MACLGIGSIEPDEGMASLQTFLGSGVSQMVLMKTIDGEVPAGPSLTEAMARHLAKQMAPVVSEKKPSAVASYRKPFERKPSFDGQRLHPQCHRPEVVRCDPIGRFP